MIPVIGNYDSFTYNLARYLGEPGADLPIAREIEVARNDRITIGEAERLAPKRTALSPAPNLDGKYSIFGKIVDGFDTPDNTEKVRRGPDGQTPIEKIELSHLPATKREARCSGGLSLYSLIAVYQISETSGQATSGPGDKLVRACINRYLSKRVPYARKIKYRSRGSND